MSCRCVLYCQNSNITFTKLTCRVKFVLVTSLPRDRLSQVTRRGMLTDTKSRTKLHTASQSEQRHVGYQRKTEMSKSPSRGNAVGRSILREQTRMEEREEVNLWDPTAELNRFLGTEESNLVRIAFFITYKPISERYITTVGTCFVDRWCGFISSFSRMMAPELVCQA